MAEPQPDPIRFFVLSATQIPSVVHTPLQVPLNCGLCDALIASFGGLRKDVAICLSCAEALQVGLLRGVVSREPAE